jgi:hypothetical protein
MNMPEHLLFHIALLCQIILVSFYLPRKILERMSYVFEQYPPSTHPKLYPRPIEYYEKSRRNYRTTNRILLVAGLLLLTVLLGYSRSGKWDHVVAMWYFFAQCLPVMLLDLSSLKETRLMRESSSTRKAVLHRRRLLDFVSPTMIGLAVFTYVAFALFVIYVRQFEFPWFGGYWNVTGVTLANLFLAGIIFRNIYGKKLNPHQAHQDRVRQVQTIARVLVSVSIAATVFVALNIASRHSSCVTSNLAP